EVAFDGKGDTDLASGEKAKKSDHFTLVFDKPVAVTSVGVTTGKASGENRLDDGTLEVSADGKTFEPLGAFAKGVASGKPKGASVRAVRIQPAAHLHHPLAVR